MDDLIGIDFGTTLCRVAVWNQADHSARIIATFPSCLLFSEIEGEEVLFGEDAFNTNNPFNTISAVRKLIGIKNAEFKDQYEKLKWEANIQFQNTDPNDEVSFGVKFSGRTKFFSPVEVTEVMLVKIKRAAEEELGHPVTGVVISVPSLFTDYQRRLTKKAAARAGFNMVRLLNETSAIALDYSVRHLVLEAGEEKNVLVFDVGGGAFSLGIVGMRDSEHRFNLTVKHLGGNPTLGGKDIEDGMMNVCLEKFLNSFKINRKEFEWDRGEDSTAETIAKSLSKLRIECVNAKTTLSSGVANEVTIQVPSFYQHKDLVYKFSQEDFRSVCENLIKKCKSEIVRALSSCKLDQNGGIHKIIVHGGTTRLYRIQRLLLSIFPPEVFDMEDGVISVVEEAVVHGAAIQAFLLTSQNPPNTIARLDKFSLHDVCAFDTETKCTKDGNPTPASIDDKLKNGEEKPNNSVKIDVKQGEDERSAKEDTLGPNQTPRGKQNGEGGILTNPSETLQELGSSSSSGNYLKDLIEAVKGVSAAITSQSEAQLASEQREIEELTLSKADLENQLHNVMTHQPTENELKETTKKELKETQKEIQKKENELRNRLDTSLEKTVVTVASCYIAFHSLLAASQQSTNDNLRFSLVMALITLIWLTCLVLLSVWWLRLTEIGSRIISLHRDQTKLMDDAVKEGIEDINPQIELSTFKCNLYRTLVVFLGLFATGFSVYVGAISYSLWRTPSAAGPLPSTPPTIQLPGLTQGFADQ